MDYIVLGSQSPRRKEILSYFTIPFTQEPPSFDESTLSFSGDPAAYAEALSKAKSSTVSAEEEALVLTADTVVFYDGVIYGKPKTIEEAHKTLSTLSGKWHQVFTAITLRKGKEIKTASEKTEILFNPLAPKQIENYCKIIHWADKAGGYAIQNNGGLIINRIDGCYFNTMGLPVNTLRQLLLTFGIELWDYLT